MSELKFKQAPTHKEGYTATPYTKECRLLSQEVREKRAFQIRSPRVFAPALLATRNHSFVLRLVCGIGNGLTRRSHHI